MQFNVILVFLIVFTFLFFILNATVILLSDAAKPRLRDTIESRGNALF